MKIIAVDNLARETVADRLVFENIDQKTGEAMVQDANQGATGYTVWWYRLVEDDYRLNKGMEDLV